MRMNSQGAGQKGKYLGDEAPLSSSRFVILPIPFDQTSTYGHGSEKGPAAIIEASRHLETYDIETDCEPHLQGIFTASPVKASNSEEMLWMTEKKATEYWEMGKFVIGLGGEHSITPALVKAAAKFHDKFSVLQFDAHADLVPLYEGNPHSHACAMARVKEIPQVSHIVSVGIRSASFEEKGLLDRPNTFFAHQIHESSDWHDRVIERLGPKVYITFDLDAFDLFLSTGTPEPGGLFWHQAMKLMRMVFQKKQVIGCDCMELSPIDKLHSPDFTAAKLIYKMIAYYTQVSSKVGNMTRRRPEFEPGFAGAETAKLKKFGDAGGVKSSG